MSIRICWMFLGSGQQLLVCSLWFQWSYHRSRNCMYQNKSGERGEGRSGSEKVIHDYDCRRSRVRASVVIFSINSQPFRTSMSAIVPIHTIQAPPGTSSLLNHLPSIPFHFFHFALHHPSCRLSWSLSHSRLPAARSVITTVLTTPSNSVVGSRTRAPLYTRSILQLVRPSSLLFTSSHFILFPFYYLFYSISYSIMFYFIFYFIF